MTTKANMALAELAEKGADTDLLRDMIQYVAQRMMDMDVESLCAAPKLPSPSMVLKRGRFRSHRSG
jgi:putative transposase